MVIDTAALIAVMQPQPEAPAYAAATRKDPIRPVPAVTAREIAILIEARQGAPGGT
jgi:uncharacterized protein with PIN domain